jgi:hypothetical protein
MSLSFILVALLVAAASATNNEEDESVLQALNKRLASAAAKASAVNSATQRALRQGIEAAQKEERRHTSVLGRKRDNGSNVVCADGTDHVDTDQDGHPDCVDACPADFRKTRPGACGCGVRDTDSDVDGRADCADECPLDFAKQAPGLCGCGAVDSGCGCNVEPVSATSCSKVLGTRRATAQEGVTFDVFGRTVALALASCCPPAQSICAPTSTLCSRSARTVASRRTLAVPMCSCRAPRSTLRSCRTRRAARSRATA